MKKSPSVTIVILNFNGLKDTRTCIKSVLKTNYTNFSITVIDNGSTVNEAKILEKEFKDKRIVVKRYEKNLGFTGGNNKIATEVDTTYLVMLNNDTVVDPNWLRFLVEEAESDTSIAACQSKVHLLSDRGKFDYAGACGGFMDKYGYPFTRGRIFFSSEEDTGQYDQKADIFWASGVCVLLRREVFIKCGMFDNFFFLYMEEIDLCWRLLKQGYRMRFVPQSTIYHKVAASAKKNMFRKRFYEHRNNLIMITKNYAAKDLLTLLPMRFLMEGITLFFYLIKGDIPSLKGLLFAHFQYWVYFPKIIAERYDDNKPIESFAPLIYPKSIVFQYFILGKKKYSQL